MIDGFKDHQALSRSLQIKDFLIISEAREILISQSLAEKIEITVPWQTTIVK
jgi:hypothetical protein